MALKDKTDKKSFTLMTLKQHTELHTNKDVEILQLREQNKKLHKALVCIDAITDICFDSFKEYGFLSTSQNKDYRKAKLIAKQALADYEKQEKK